MHCQKSALFSKMLFEYRVPLNMRLRMQPDLLLLSKWPVFLQNASDNPICDTATVILEFMETRWKTLASSIQNF